MVSAAMGPGLVPADLSTKIGELTPWQNRAATEEPGCYGHQVETVGGRAFTFSPPDRIAPIVHKAGDVAPGRAHPR
jgi:hypothetical protein